MTSVKIELGKIKWTLARKGFFFISTTLLVQLIFFACLAFLLQQSEFITQKQSHSKEVFGRANWLAALMSMNSLSCVSYAITNDPYCFGVYDWTKKRVPSELKELTAILTEPQDEVQRQQIKTSEAVWTQITEIADQQLISKKMTDPELLTRLRKDESKLKSLWLDLVKARSEALLEERTRVDTTKESPTRNRDDQKAILEAGVAISILVAIITSNQFSKRITKRIDVLANNSMRLARGEPLTPPIPGSDEIAHLDQTFHGMAEELNTAKLQLEASERRMVTLIANMPVGLLTVDREGKIEFANSACKDMFVETEPTGMVLQSLLPLPVADVQSVLGRSNMQQPIELNVTRVGANPVVLEISSKPIFMAEGEKRLIMLQDVTQRHELEKLKQEFLAMVSHDLRTPLSSIDLFLHLVQRLAADVMPPLVRDNLVIAERSTKRLLNLVNDLLDIEQIQTGKMVMNYRWTPVSSVIEQSIAAVKNFAEQRSIKLEFTETNVEFEADDERLIQVLVNLLSNAIKFSPDGSTVTISTLSEDKWVELRVKDMGRGVPETHKQSIFERYKQVERSDAKRGAGTGLGLPICKAIIEQHGGAIGVENSTEPGSIFWFKIPQRQNNERES